MSSQPQPTFGEQLVGCLGAIIVMALILILFGTCFGSEPRPVDTTDYIKTHGLPPDPRDRTPAR